MEHNIPAPFNPEDFRRDGHKLVDTLSDYLSEIMTGKNWAVLPWHDPDELTEMFSFESGGGEKETFEDYTKRIIRYSHHLHHPHYIGHQVTSPLPLTALIHLCTALLNNGAAVYEMGPVAMAMEKNIINLIGKKVGYKGNFDGIFTHGGSAGNLTAMLAARQVMSDYNIWEEGVKENRKIGFIVSDQSHYGIVRNVKIMGLGDDSLVKIQYNRQFRMRTPLLEECQKEAGKRGIRVVGVVANSCSTATGSYDDLEAVADFCEKHGLWMHVDGAHGLGVLFSDKYRSRIKGIERADSMVIDFHKMLLVSGLNTLVLFKNGDRSYETFAQKASYLFRKPADNEWYNSARRTLECTKSALGVVAYTALKYYGNSYYREYIDSRYDLASLFAEIIDADDDMELAVHPDANIVCFRFAPVNHNDTYLNRINSIIRDKIIKEGSFFIVQTELEGKIWLRVAIINPIISENDLRELVKRIKEIGNTILQ